MNFPDFETKLSNNCCNQDSCSFFKSKICSMYNLLVKTFFRAIAFGLVVLITGRTTTLRVRAHGDIKLINCAVQHVFGKTFLAKYNIQMKSS